VTKNRIPVWPIVGVVLFILIAIVSTIYLALALAICVGVLLLAYWGFTQLPERFGGSRDDRH
jgi:hypothetical protein